MAASGPGSPRDMRCGATCSRPSGMNEPQDTNMKLILICCLSICFACLPLQGKSLYQNDFEQAEVGKAPDDFLILEGGFAVKLEAGNKFLELPAAPLDSFAAL